MRLIAFVFVLSLVACGPSRRDDPEDTDTVVDAGPAERDGGAPDAGAVTCAAGTRTACTCDSGEEGLATCVADGSRYGVCLCGAPPACTPGGTRACTCEGGQGGAETCQANGAAFGACECGQFPGRLKVCVAADGTGAERCLTPSVVNGSLAIDFGSVAAGSQVARAVTVTNVGSGALAYALQDDAANGFRLASPLAGSLTAGGSANGSLAFTGTSEGELAGSLVVTSDDPAAPLVRIALGARVVSPKLCIFPTAGLDFGVVAPGDEKTLSVVVRNCGGAPERIDAITVEPAAQPFALAGFGALPRTLAPGDDVSVLVTYDPPAASTTPANARLSIRGAGGAVSVPLTGATSAMNPCTANAPVARLQVLDGAANLGSAPRVAPGTTVTITAAGSSAPNGGATYAWLLDSRPSTSTARLTGSGDRVTLTADLVGTYVVRVTLTDARGCTNGASATIVASQTTPGARLRVELTWDASGDLDLHYTGPGGRLHERSDVNYLHREPDWGLNGTTAPDQVRSNDPTLDADAMWGFGPEQVTHAAPFAATYTVTVTHYCSRKSDPTGPQGYAARSSGPSAARVKLFVDGQLAREITRSLTQRDVWKVAEIVVAPSGAITYRELPDAVVKTTGEHDACTPAVD